MVYNKTQTDRNKLSTEEKYYQKMKLQKEQESAGSNEKIKTPTLARYMQKLLVSETY